MDPQDNSSNSSFVDGDEAIDPREVEEMFAELNEALAEIEETKERELEQWLAEWKVLTDAGEAWLRELGYTNETVYAECFEEIMSGEEVESDVEIVQLTDEEYEEGEDEDGVEDDRGSDGGSGGGYGDGGGGGGTTGGLNI